MYAGTEWVDIWLLHYPISLITFLNNIYSILYSLFFHETNVTCQFSDSFLTTFLHFYTNFFEKIPMVRTRLKLGHFYSFYDTLYDTDMPTYNTRARIERKFFLKIEISEFLKNRKNFPDLKFRIPIREKKLIPLFEHVFYIYHNWWGMKIVNFTTARNRGSQNIGFIKKSIKIPMARTRLKKM